MSKPSKSDSVWQLGSKFLHFMRPFGRMNRWEYDAKADVPVGMSAVRGGADVACQGHQYQGTARLPLRSSRIDAVITASSVA